MRQLSIRTCPLFLALTRKEDGNAESGSGLATGNGMDGRVRVRVAKLL
jgi:hypothetical protein